VIGVGGFAPPGPGVVGAGAAGGIGIGRAGVVGPGMLGPFGAGTNGLAGPPGHGTLGPRYWPPCAGSVPTRTQAATNGISGARRGEFIGVVL
jgi:hypothetical protein